MFPAKLKEIPRWCVSKNKIPLDIFALKKNLEWGASDKRSHSSYGTYQEAAEIGAKKGNLPTTLYVDTAQQSIYVIDIEKTCPAEIRQQILLALHDSIIYVERSLSGKGYHLIIDMPSQNSLPTAKYKKWFEILTNHHCTFTMDEIDIKTAFYEHIDTNEFITDDDNDVDLLNALKTSISPYDFYNLIGSDAVKLNLTENSTFEEYKKVAATFDNRHADLFGLMCDMDYNKTVDSDFHGDYSSYEFGYASKLHYLLKRLSQDMIDADCNHYTIDMTKEQSVMLVYMVLKQMMAPRDKHKEYRNGLPWLLYTSLQVYSKTFE